MLENALTGFKTQVQAIKARVALLQRIDHAQALHIVFKAAIILHAGIERILPGMPEWGMPKVVCQRNGFNQVLIQRQCPRDTAANLSHLQRMRQTRAKQISLVVQKHLGFVDQTPKGR